MSYKEKLKLIIVAGPNGAGKTTITEQLLRHEWMQGCVYVNPDEIAEKESTKKWKISGDFWDLFRRYFYVGIILAFLPCLRAENPLLFNFDGDWDMDRVELEDNTISWIEVDGDNEYEHLIYSAPSVSPYSYSFLDLGLSDSNGDNIEDFYVSKVHRVNNFGYYGYEVSWFALDGFGGGERNVFQLNPHGPADTFFFNAQDVDNDGNVDVFVNSTREGGACCSSFDGVLYNLDGMGDFSEQQRPTLESPRFGVARRLYENNNVNWDLLIRTGNVDSDGVDDLVFFENGSGLKWFKGIAEGGYEDAPNIGFSTTEFYPQHIILSDYDKDGDMDVFCAIDQTYQYMSDPVDSLYLLENDGAGFFSSSSIRETLTAYYASGDFDNDGEVEILHYDGESIILLENTKSNPFQTEQIVATVPLFEGGSMRDYLERILTADLNEDDLSDIVVRINHGATSIGAVLGADILWFKNLGNFTFAEPVLIFQSNDTRTTSHSISIQKKAIISIMILSNKYQQDFPKLSVL